ncbi:MAG: hypothetical protein QNJ55_14290 [Xenococcus sp. MO_188.B8]|nr:hypothetical protein [Xenococcus sp. MO_188.B8]
MATNARIEIITNGIIYKFYADLDKKNKMDEIPFLELDLLNLNKLAIKEVSKLTKSEFDINAVLKSAVELKYIAGIKALLKKQMQSPNEEFAEYFFKELCPKNVYKGNFKEDFLEYTFKGIKEFVTEEMNNLSGDLVNFSGERLSMAPDHEQLSREFTQDERQGYYMLKVILSSVVASSRLTSHKDQVGNCNILLDSNLRRPIVGFDFNNPQHKKLEIFSLDSQGDQVAERVSINNLNKIYSYADQFKAIVAAYEGKAILT